MWSYIPGVQRTEVSNSLQLLRITVQLTDIIASFKEEKFGGDAQGLEKENKRQECYKGQRVCR